MCGLRGLRDHQFISVKQFKTIPDFLEKINTFTDRIKELYSRFEITFHKGNIHSIEYSFDILKTMLHICLVQYKVVHKNDGNYLKIISKHDVCNVFDYIEKNFISAREIEFDITPEITLPSPELLIVEKRQSAYCKNKKLFYEDLKKINLSKESHLLTELTVKNLLPYAIEIIVECGGQTLFTEILKPQVVTNILSKHISFIPYVKYQTMLVKIVNENLSYLSYHYGNILDIDATYVTDTTYLSDKILQLRILSDTINRDGINGEKKCYIVC